jgi:uncharacterized protein YciU (UPF0263 family)
MIRVLPLLVVPMLSSCLPLGLGGTVLEHELSFVDVTYAEIRRLDLGTSTPVHPIDIFLMPMQDPCANFGRLTAELEALREELGFGMGPEEYCDTWEGLFEESIGHLDGFWVGWFRLNALPRPDGDTPQTTYEFLEEDGADTPDGPTFDLELAWYPPTTFDACATEFSGDSFYAPTLLSATGGTAAITQYSEDDTITTRFDPFVEEAEENPLTGQAKATFCPDALDWSLEFGLGQARR